MNALVLALALLAAPAAQAEWQILTPQDWTPRDQTDPQQNDVLVFWWVEQGGYTLFWDYFVSGPRELHTLNLSPVPAGTHVCIYVWAWENRSQEIAYSRFACGVP